VRRAVEDDAGAYVGVDICDRCKGIRGKAKVFHDAKEVSVANGVEGVSEVNI
jgi:hypothetical protein